MKYARAPICVSWDGVEAPAEYALAGREGVFVEKGWHQISGHNPRYATFQRGSALLYVEEDIEHIPRIAFTGNQDHLDETVPARRITGTVYVPAPTETDPGEVAATFENLARAVCRYPLTIGEPLSSAA